MKKRNVAVVVILHIITLGIYFLYWAYKTRKDLVAQNGNPTSIPPFKWLLLPFLSFIPLFIPLAFLPTSESDIWANSWALLLMLGGTLLLFLLAVTASIVVFFWWFYSYCKVASEVTKGIEFTPSYVLLIMSACCGILVVWQALVQHDINKAVDRLATRQSTAA